MTGISSKLLQGVEGIRSAACEGLSGEGGDAGAFLIRDFDGRDAMMIAGKPPFCPERILFPGGHVIVDGGIDSESKVLALIHNSCKHKVSQPEDRSALTDIAGVEMCRITSIISTAVPGVASTSRAPQLAAKQSLYSGNL